MKFELIFPLVIALLWLVKSIVLIRAEERGVVLRLGRMQPEVKPPGLSFIYWPIDTVYRVSLREQTLEVPAREVRVDDRRTLNLGATLKFRVLDALLAFSQVQNYQYALSELASLKLKDVARRQAVEKYLASDETLGENLRKLLGKDAETWGIEILDVQVRPF